MICMLFFASFSGATSLYITTYEKINEISDNQNYSHTVFAGVAFTQSCGPCNNWSKNIFDTYMTELYDFEYASMIGYDENGNVLNYDAVYWSLNYTIGIFPTTIIDGDFERISGDHIEELPDKLNSCGNRTVANITSNITAILVGNATLNITIIIENNEETQYNGYIRVFITEIISRYLTSLGNPFKFGFLDFAFNKNITINPGGIYKDSIVWNGFEHEDAHGDNFGDIKANNIQVALVTYNISSGYVDNTAVARVPNNPPYRPRNQYPLNGEIDVRPDADLRWKCTDPDGDELVYDVYLGITNPPPLFASDVPENVFDPGLLEFETKYYWYIVSKDNRGGTNNSMIWNFTTKFNYIPAVPSIPYGPSEGNVGEELVYVTTSFDPDEDDLYYWFDWGNGNKSGWVGPFESYEIANASYIWPEGGDFDVKVKVKDEYGAESKFSGDFPVHITEPNLEIDNLSGGLFRISADINNIGDGEANNIDWKIKLVSGIVIVGRESSGDIDDIQSEGEENIESGFIFGLGKTDIIIEANLEYGKDEIYTTEAFLLGFYIIIRE
ncbi:hypothetical protein AYK21_00675 [Thermoplasmatales archaeon SG8-52-2]|nr:MAG: hypothetical protein AYK21_00675 [Thermoplasmatales archaeon SG8-52-2]